MMMENEKHSVDLLFNEALKNYSEAPPEMVWDNISNEMAGIKAAKSKVLLTKLSIAASFLLIASAGLWFMLSNNSQTTTIENNIANNISTEISKSQNNLNAIETESTLIESNNNKVLNKSENTFKTNQTTKISNTTSNTLASTNSPSAETRNEPIENDMEYTATNYIKNDVATIETSNTTIIEEAVIEENENDIAAIDTLKENRNTLPIFDNSFADYPVEMEPLNEDDNSKWAVGGQVSPTYTFRHIASNANNSYAYYQESETGLVSYAGGVNVQYSNNSRWSVKTGIYYSKMGMNINNYYYKKKAYSIPVSQITDHSNQIDLQNSTGSVALNNFNTIDDNSIVTDPNGTSMPKLDQIEYFEQNFKFVDIPVQVSYLLIDKKVNVNLHGGIGANVLVQNSITYFEENNSGDFGSTNDVNTFNYSSSFGLGFAYELSASTQINLEPTFRYYLNSLNAQSTNVHPYSIGVFTGVTYRF